MTTERRKHSRIAFQAPATLILPEMTIDSVVLDLSLKGALIRLPSGTTAPDGIVGKLHVHLNETLAEINMEIKVVHVEGRYAGLLCLGIDIDSVTHLRRLVELNLGDPALLEREVSALVAD